MKCFALAKSSKVRFRQISYTIDQVQPMLIWQSRQDELGPPEVLEKAKPYWFRFWSKEKGIPPLKENQDMINRETAQRAHQMLLRFLDQDPRQLIYPALGEMVDQLDKDTRREITNEKKLSQLTYFGYRHAFHCQMAIDNYEYLFGELSRDSKQPLFVRGLLIETLNRWLGLQRNHDYQLLNMLKRPPYSYEQGRAARTVELLHYISDAEANKPRMYELLIDGLNSKHFEIRLLSHWHLLILVPAGAEIRYDPTAPVASRSEATKAWRALIPPGQLPKKKDKG
jgi:hypothetical protein